MLGDSLFAQFTWALKTGGVIVALWGQVGSSTTPPSSNAQQPGLSPGQPGNAQSQTQSSQQPGTSQLGTQSGSLGTVAQAGPSTSSQPPEVNDALLAACLIVDNEGEIAISDLGRQRAQNAEVKKFAEQMVTDHTAMLATLRQVRGVTASVSKCGGSSSNGRRSDFAQSERDNPGSGANTERGAPTTAGATPSQPANNKAAAPSQTGTAQPGGTATVAVPTNSGGSTFASLKREVGAQCLQSKQQESESKNGAEFDKCFMEMQLAMHMDALDMLKVYQRHAAGELRQIIDEAIPKVTAHLDHAKMTKKGLEPTAAAQPDAIRK